ncbi:MAG TPA: amino acid aminotransferase [Burkholderiales bacterium]|jgi:aromatic-amino-acid transaminase|nr:amino acid aminotransferase [Burkholderiales bacterium]
MKIEESLLANVKMAPRDAILGLTETFLADSNPKKVNLGVGVYYDDQGKVPLLECVRRADEALTAAAVARPYLAMDGFPEFIRSVQGLLFGPDHPAVAQGRVTTVQAVGGTGALKVGVDFIRRFAPGAAMYISDPSYDNHRPLFEEAGFKVEMYPYYDPRTRGIKFAEMIAYLSAAPKASVVLLHACCHNPTGVDIRGEQWDEVMKVVAERRLIPFLDFAYQGFGEGVDEDAEVARRFAEALPLVLVAMSFSKSFSLYGERVGSLSVVTADPGEAARVLSHLKRMIRTNYSNPPSHGARIVASVLASPELRALWRKEVVGMRDRVRSMRRELVDRLKKRIPDDFGFILQQRGIFSYSGLSREQMIAMRERFSVYGIESGRICVAALTSRNLDYVADAIASTVRMSEAALTPTRAA